VRPVNKSPRIMLATMYSHHKFGHEYVDSPPPSASYVVCSIARSGGSLLCDVLASTELAGAPTEYFDSNHVAAFSKEWGVAGIDDYLRTLLRKKTSPNGVFGLKAHFHQLRRGLRECDVAEVLPDPKFVYVSRRDHVRQAVSWSRAIQTGQWTSNLHSRERSPRFVFAEIEQLVERIEREEALWDRFFARRGVQPMRIEYEELVGALDTAVFAVLGFVGVEVPTDFVVPAPTLRRQADPLSDEWTRRFRESTAARDSGTTQAPSSSAIRAAETAPSRSTFHSPTSS
jgi:trehalose 2-sulfotransferase